MAALSWIAASKKDFKSCLEACSTAKFECSGFFSYKPREFSFRPKGKEVIFLAPVENIGNNVFSVSADDDTLTRKKVTENNKQLILFSPSLSSCVVLKAGTI